MGKKSKRSKGVKVKHHNEHKLKYTKNRRICTCRQAKPAPVEISGHYSSPLWVACAHGQVETAAYLIEAGSAYDWVNEHGQSPLWVAAQQGHLEVVKELLNKGANINLPAAGTISPLLAALVYNQLDVADYLHNRGALVLCSSKDCPNLEHYKRYEESDEVDTVVEKIEPTVNVLEEEPPPLIDGDEFSLHDDGDEFEELDFDTILQQTKREFADKYGKVEFSTAGSQKCKV